jgi:PIN domain nuclease of toxin-antitoxin system
VTAPLIDTHVWIWWMDGDERLPARVRDALDECARSTHGHQRTLPYLCDVSLWEMALLVQRKRYEPSLDLDEWLDATRERPSFSTARRFKNRHREGREPHNLTRLHGLHALHGE